MKQVINYAPPYSLFVLTGRDELNVPDCGPQPVSLWSTSSCIIVAGRMFQDAESEVTLSDDPQDIKLENPVFDGDLETPLRRVDISTAEFTFLIHCKVPNDTTRVRIWTDHPTEPDHILIVLG